MAIRLRVECAATWRFLARGEASGGLRTRSKLVHPHQKKKRERKREREEKKGNFKFFFTILNYFL